MHACLSWASFAIMMYVHEFTASGAMSPEEQTRIREVGKTTNERNIKPVSNRSCGKSFGFDKVQSSIKLFGPTGNAFSKLLDLWVSKHPRLHVLDVNRAGVLHPGKTRRTVHHSLQLPSERCEKT